MTNRQIEASREIRLWITQVIIPVFGIAMIIPECREAVVTKAKEVGAKIKTTLQK